MNSAEELSKGKSGKRTEHARNIELSRKTEQLNSRRAEQTNLADQEELSKIIEQTNSSELNRQTEQMNCAEEMSRRT